MKVKHASIDQQPVEKPGITKEVLPGFLCGFLLVFSEQQHVVVFSLAP